MALKSKEKIIQTLLDLMEQHQFEDITVAEICANANISRGTFYNHFPSKESVIRTYTREIAMKYLDTNVKIDEDWAKNIAYDFFTLSKSNSWYFSLLHKQNLFHLLRKEWLDSFCHHENIVNQEIFLKMSDSIRHYGIVVYASVGVALYEEWANKGFIETSEEMAKLYEYLLKSYNT